MLYTLRLLLVAVEVHLCTHRFALTPLFYTCEREEPIRSFTIHTYTWRLPVSLARSRTYKCAISKRGREESRAREQLASITSIHYPRARPTGFKPMRNIVGGWLKGCVKIFLFLSPCRKEVSEDIPYGGSFF